MHKKLYLVLFPLILIYLSINFYTYILVDCWVPDEKAFFQSAISSEYGFKGFILAENKFGYGTFYWWILSIANYFNNFKILRLLSFTYLTLIPVLIWLIGKKLGKSKIFRMYACLLFITYPSSWFYGKIIGPELLSVFLGILSFYLSLERQTRLIGFVLIGVSVGVKLNSISIFLFLYLFRILTLYNSNVRIQRLVKETIYIGGCLIIGFLISTPIFIIDPKKVFENILIYSSNNFFNFSLHHILFSFTNTWDGIINNGLFNVSINIFILLLILIFAFNKTNDFRILFSFIAASIFLTLQILYASNYLFWYWFPIIFLSPIVIFSFKENKTTNLIFGIAITMNFILNISFIFEKVKYRLMHENILSKKNSIEEFIKSVENKNLETDYFYFTEFGITPEPSYNVWSIFRGLEKEGSMIDKQKLSNKPKILFLGTRFLKIDPSWENIIQNKFQKQGFSLSLIGNCKEMKAFQLLHSNESNNFQSTN